MRLGLVNVAFVLVVGGAIAAAQVTGAKLKGVVIADEIGGTPMGNVAIFAGDDASPTASDPITGTFSFIFPKKRPGQTVQLYVKAKGYAVVNDIQLRVTLPDDPELNSNNLTIVLCRNAALQEMKGRFYRVKSSQAIDAGYAQRMKSLDARHIADVTEVKQVTKERDQARAEVERMSYELAKVNKPSELYTRAMQAFLAGKLQEATGLLEEEKLNRQLKSANETLAGGIAEREQVMNEWLLKGRLLTLQFRFDDAEHVYKSAVDKFPDNIDANMAYAYFNVSLNRFHLAEESYKRCLELAQRSGNDADRAAMLHNLGNLDRAQNRMDEARQHYEEALKIREELAKKNPDKYLPGLALTLNNLGNLDHDQKWMDQARQHLERALKIYQELALKNPDAYLFYATMTLNNLGSLDRDQKRMDEARQHYEKALKTFKILAQCNPDTYLPYVADTLNNLGALDADQKRTDEARQCFVEALDILNGLASKNPEKYLPDVAMKLNNLGFLDINDRPDEAREYLEKALKIRRELALKDPDTYLPDVVKTLNNLGSLDRTQKRINDARAHYEDALGIEGELVLKHRDTYLPYLAETLATLGFLNKDQNRGEACRYFEEALDNYNELAQKHPDVYGPNVEIILRNLRNLDYSQN